MTHKPGLIHYLATVAFLLASCGRPSNIEGQVSNPLCKVFIPRFSDAMIVIGLSYIQFGYTPEGKAIVNTLDHPSVDQKHLTSSPLKLEEGESVQLRDLKVTYGDDGVLVTSDSASCEVIR